MGRPLTKKWTGIKSQAEPVLTPYCNIDGYVSHCWILGQIGANKYAVRSITLPGVTGTIKLTNGDVSAPGSGFLEWRTANAAGYVKSITDKKLKTFHGATLEWSIHAATDTVAHVVTNSVNR